MVPHLTLGTSLRHLVELLDDAVHRSYSVSGLDYRPRYTPVVRALHDLGPSSIRKIAFHARITHSAASQTVAQMVKEDLIRLGLGADLRERVASMTPRLRRMLPELERCWAATDAAAAELDGELTASLLTSVAEAIAALDVRPFDERIAARLSRREPLIC